MMAKCTTADLSCQQWVRLVLEYNVSFQHIGGELNVVADMLSRASYDDEEELNPETEVDECVSSKDDVNPGREEDGGPGGDILTMRVAVQCARPDMTQGAGEAEEAQKEVDGGTVAFSEADYDGEFQDIGRWLTVLGRGESLKVPRRV